MSEPALTLDRVERTYEQAGTPLHILRGVSFELQPGQSVALIAPSGTGKSTLLHVAGLLEKPDGGEVYLGRTPTSKLADGARTALRRTAIGFVYQFHHLLPEFSALENIVMPQMIAGLSRREAERRAAELLDYLGLAARGHHRPPELSGGEQQRGRSPAPSPTVPACCSPTSRPATSIPPRRRTCSARSPRSCRRPASRRWSRRTTWRSPAAWTAV
jgi:lipoprotein-releasing system ATP-binding protein